MDLAAKAYASLAGMETMARTPSRVRDLDPRAKTVVLAAYLAVLASLDAADIAGTAAMAIYPAAMAYWARTGFCWVALRSLAVLPFVVGIGLFNPWFDRAPGFVAGYETGLSHGWLSFFGIVMRSLLAAQAALLLVASTGFGRLCSAWGALGMPRALANQLLMMYRYLFVLVEEALSLKRGHAARCGGKKPALAVWAAMTSQLLLRSVHRAHRIDNAMKSRGFNGTLPCAGLSWALEDTAFVAAWGAVFLLLRLLHPADAWLNLLLAPWN